MVSENPGLDPRAPPRPLRHRNGDAGPGSASRYRWRNGNIRANLDVEGGITFHLPNGHELGITFPGAKPGVEPLGESASYPVSYYLASAQSWQSGMRWERVRYRQI